MSKGQTEAELLLRELRAIPKLIQELQRDIEATRSSLLTSPQWSDMKVEGGLKQSQEDKNIRVIDNCDWHVSQIGKLNRRKTEILDIIFQLKDNDQRRVLIAAYLTYDTYTEAYDALFMSKAKFFTIKRKAVENLNRLI
ncbi:DUF1492 domain-containing protein [Streptococcus pluranimalium]|uniref:DUF1492 domain-containing protein n=1 Tax=Streptococcus pluranimalium TaxID=82348 RepID=A0A345VII8_9STRE|nr:DUF1492 domain-containing protein [Streptococcus pluranimalium]AXJ12540.1 hypothetical protein Sp14A_06100 [Streptococcus pluranimalium]